MADSNNLAAEKLLPRFVESIECRVGTYGHIPIVEIVETIGGIGHFAQCGSIPVSHDAIGVHHIVERETRGDVDVFEELERGINRDAVMHTIAPVLDEVGMEQLILFR